MVIFGVISFYITRTKGAKMPIKRTAVKLECGLHVKLKNEADKRGMKLYYFIDRVVETGLKNLKKEKV